MSDATSPSESAPEPPEQPKEPKEPKIALQVNTDKERKPSSIMLPARSSEPAEPQRSATGDMSPGSAHPPSRAPQGKSETAIMSPITAPQDATDMVRKPSISFTEPSSEERSHRGSFSVRLPPAGVSAVPSGGASARPGKEPAPSRSAELLKQMEKLHINKLSGYKLGSASAGSGSLEAQSSASPGGPLSSGGSGGSGGLVNSSNSGAAPQRKSNSASTPRSPSPRFEFASGEPFHVHHHLPAAPHATETPITATNATCAQQKRQWTPQHLSQFFQKQDDGKIHVLLGVTGSVATIKAPLIINKLLEIYGHSRISIQLVVTKPALHFLKTSRVPPEVQIWTEDDEWYSWQSRNDSILHIELRRWADIMLIAPLSANSLAKIANGLCDNLLLSVVRAWNPAQKILVAPAMNTFMYTNPMTKKHLEVIRQDFPWIEVLKPVEKVLVCGDIGMGGMREWSDLVEVLVKRIGVKVGEEDEDEEEGEDEDEERENEDEQGDDDDEDEDEDEGEEEGEEEGKREEVK